MASLTVSQYYTFGYCAQQQVTLPVAIILLVWLYCKEEDYWASCTNVAFNSKHTTVTKKPNIFDSTKVYSILTTKIDIYPNAIYIWSLLVKCSEDIKFGVYVQNKNCMFCFITLVILLMYTICLLQIYNMNGIHMMD